MEYALDFAQVGDFYRLDNCKKLKKEKSKFCVESFGSNRNLIDFQLHFFTRTKDKFTIVNVEMP
jgi:hypothetical protein